MSVPATSQFNRGKPQYVANVQGWLLLNVAPNEPVSALDASQRVGCEALRTGSLCWLKS